VQAARGDVGRDEDFDLAALEFSEQAFALGLRHVAGQRGDAEALRSSARDFFGGDLGVDEDDAAMRFQRDSRLSSNGRFSSLAGK
jgi:hypothetical protein